MSKYKQLQNKLPKNFKCLIGVNKDTFNLICGLVNFDCGFKVSEKLVLQEV